MFRIVIVALVIVGCALQQESVGAVDSQGAPKKKDAQAESISPGFKNRSADNPQDTTKQSDDQNARMADYTLGIVILTFLLAVAAYAQVEITRRTARRQLRAYVVVQKATVTVAAQATGNERIVTARVTFLNAGQTPAYKLEHRRSIRIGEWLEQRPAFPEAGPFRRTMAILGPKVEHPDDLGISTTITGAQWRDLVNGGAIYFWGEVTYRDIFKKERRTPFAVRYPRIVSKLDDTSTVACPDGNDAT